MSWGSRLGHPEQETSVAVEVVDDRRLRRRKAWQPITSSRPRRPRDLVDVIAAATTRTTTRPFDGIRTRVRPPPPPLGVEQCMIRQVMGSQPAAAAAVVGCTNINAEWSSYRLRKKPRSRMTSMGEEELLARTAARMVTTVTIFEDDDDAPVAVSGRQRPPPPGASIRPVPPPRVAVNILQAAD